VIGPALEVGNTLQKPLLRQRGDSIMTPTRACASTRMIMDEPMPLFQTEIGLKQRSSFGCLAADLPLQRDGREGMQVDTLCPPAIPSPLSLLYLAGAAHRDAACRIPFVHVAWAALHRSSPGETLHAGESVLHRTRLCTAMGTRHRFKPASLPVVEVKREWKALARFLCVKTKRSHRRSRTLPDRWLALLCPGSSR